MHRLHFLIRNHTKTPPIWHVASSATGASPFDGAQLRVCIWMRVLVAHGSECTGSWCPRLPEAAARRVAWHGIRVERHWFYIMSSQRVATLSTHSGGGGVSDYVKRFCALFTAYFSSTWINFLYNRWMHYGAPVKTGLSISSSLWQLSEGEAGLWILVVEARYWTLFGSWSEIKPNSWH